MIQKREIQQDPAAEPRNMVAPWGLVGIPDHEAVIPVGGRIGAARGPESFRKVFKKLRGRQPIQERLIDLGDVPGLDADISANHEKAARLVREAHRRAHRSLVVGGSHDHGFSQLQGVSRWLSETGQAPNTTPSSERAAPRLGCINIDAHLDVRKPSPTITSGSPFFLALESGILAPSLFVEFGIQSHCNGPELWTYAETKGLRIIPFEETRWGKSVSLFADELKRLADSCDAIVLSLDLDSAAQAFAPGVSAPQAEGFTSSELVAMAELAARNPKVVSLGIFELNPEHDVDSRTARLAATVAYHWLQEQCENSP
jgi:formimidoylglutamase